MKYISKMNKWTLHDKDTSYGQWEIEKQIDDIPETAEKILDNLKHLCIPYFFDFDLIAGETYKDSSALDFKEKADFGGFSPREIKELILQAVSVTQPESGNIFIQLNLGLKVLLSFYSKENKIITQYLPTNEMLNNFIKDYNNKTIMSSLIMPLNISIYPTSARLKTYSNIWIPGILPSEGNEELARINGPRFNEMLHIFEKTMCSDITRWQSGLYNVEKYGFPGGYDTTSEWGRERDSELKDYIKAQNG